MSRKWDPKTKTWVQVSDTSGSKASPEIQRLKTQTAAMKVRSEALDSLSHGGKLAGHTRKWNPKTKKFELIETPAKKGKVHRGLLGSIAHEAGHLGGEALHKTANIAGRGLDIISRTGYASAEAVRRSNAGLHDIDQVVDRKTGKLKPGAGGVTSTLSEFAKGAGQGITGKKKTSYSQVLKEMGVKNKWVQAGGGLIGDIGLDPGTFVSGGLTEAKAADELGMRAAAETVTDGLKKKAVKDSVAKVRKAAEQRHLAAGVSPTEAKHLAKEEARAHGIQETLKQAEETRTAVREANARVAQLKVAGQVVAQSERLGRGAQKVARVVGDAPVIGPLNRAFRTAATQPGHLGNRLRRLLTGGVGEWERDAHEVERAWGRGLTLDQMDAGVKGHRLSQEDRNLIRTYLEKEDFSDPVLGPVAKDMRDHMNHVHDFKQLLGLAPADQPKMFGYVPVVVHGELKQTGKDLLASRKARLVKDPQTGQMVWKAGNHNVTLDALVHHTEKGTKLVRDPIESYKMELADFYHARARKQFSDEVHAQFGFKPENARQAEALKEMGMERSKDGLYLPKNVKKMTESVDKVFNDSTEMKKLLHMYDTVLRGWKTSATVINPGHHFRNAASDILLAFGDGLQNPGQMTRGLYYYARRGSEKRTLDILGKKVSPATMHDLFIKHGGGSGFMRSDFGREGFNGRNPISHVLEGIRNVGEKRENSVRFSHYLWAVDQEAKNLPRKMPWAEKLQEASRRAVDRVTTGHVDYRNLTNVENDVMKRVIPFYTWMRHSTPLILTQMLTNPGHIAKIPKGMRAIETLLGQQGMYPDLPHDQTIPKWMRELMPMYLGGGEGDAGTAKFLAPPNPYQEGLNYLANPVQTIGSGISPALKDPIEYFTNKNWFTGGPAKQDNESVLSYLIRQVPAGRQAINLTSGGISTPEAKQAGFVNWLTGGGLQVVNDARRASELRRQQDPYKAKTRKARERMREEAKRRHGKGH